MTHEHAQKVLAGSQISEFYHDLFVETQVAHFRTLVRDRIGNDGVVVDVGGGCGFFAKAIKDELSLPVRVIDSDPVSVAKAGELGVDAIQANALTVVPSGDESAVCFNLILHHLVAASDASTRELQLGALGRWKQAGVAVFVNEYIYDSWFRDISGKLIFLVTSSRLLSAIASTLGKFIPAFRANTFGVGVRFRSAAEWQRLFEASGWRVDGVEKGEEEPVSVIWRLLLIKSCRRDSFVLSSQ